MTAQIIYVSNRLFRIYATLYQLYVSIYVTLFRIYSSTCSRVQRTIIRRTSCLHIALLRHQVYLRPYKESLVYSQHKCYWFKIAVILIGQLISIKHVHLQDTQYHKKWKNYTKMHDKYEICVYLTHLLTKLQYFYFFGTGWPEDDQDCLKNFALLIRLININIHKVVLKKDEWFFNDLQYTTKRLTQNLYSTNNPQAERSNKADTRSRWQ
jgi:hypothetical protein